MCFELMIHYTQCETQRISSLEPAFPEFYFDIYHPFEPPGRCPQHEENRPSCPDHGRCCNRIRRRSCVFWVGNGDDIDLIGRQFIAPVQGAEQLTEEEEQELYEAQLRYINHGISIRRALEERRSAWITDLNPPLDWRPHNDMWRNQPLIGQFDEARDDWLDACKMLIRPGTNPGTEDIQEKQSQTPYWYKALRVRRSGREIVPDAVEEYGLPADDLPAGDPPAANLQLDMQWPGLNPEQQALLPPLPPLNPELVAQLPPLPDLAGEPEDVYIPQPEPPAVQQANPVAGQIGPNIEQFYQVGGQVEPAHGLPAEPAHGLADPLNEPVEQEAPAEPAPEWTAEFLTRLRDVMVQEMDDEDGAPVLDEEAQPEEDRWLGIRVSGTLYVPVHDPIVPPLEAGIYFRLNGFPTRDLDDPPDALVRLPAETLYRVLSSARRDIVGNREQSSSERGESDDEVIGSIEDDNGMGPVDISSSTVSRMTQDRREVSPQSDREEDESEERENAPELPNPPPRGQRQGHAESSRWTRSATGRMIQVEPGSTQGIAPSPQVLEAGSQVVGRGQNDHSSSLLSDISQGGLQNLEASLRAAQSILVIPAGSPESDLSTGISDGALQELEDDLVASGSNVPGTSRKRSAEENEAEERPLPKRRQPPKKRQQPLRIQPARAAKKR